MGTAYSCGSCPYTGEADSSEKTPKFPRINDIQTMQGKYDMIEDYSDSEPTDEPVSGNNLAPVPQLVGQARKVFFSFFSLTFFNQIIKTRVVLSGELFLEKKEM